MNSQLIDIFNKRLDDLDTSNVDRFREFKNMFAKYLNHEKIEWEKAKSIPNTKMVNLEDCIEPSQTPKQLLSKLVIMKLNGGLGTTMGCKGPKSAIEVRDNLTFLDIIIKQIELLNEKYDVNIPLVLMNSFNTHEQTQKIINKYRNVKIYTFNQSRFPRIYKDSLTPMVTHLDDSDERWYPPGHGDMYKSFKSSGLLDYFIKEGKTSLFVSNIDNLGATIDLKILNHLNENNLEYLMEVTKKTRSDIKGGTLIEYDGRIKLLELAQVPHDNIEEFKSIKKFKVFNTNNIWCSLSAIDRILKEDTMKDMDVIVNHKICNGKNIIQLERAIGAGIEFFNAQGVQVPRNRFLPVKSTSDLFLIMSNLYTLSNYELVVNPSREFELAPLVKLGSDFKSVQNFLTRISDIPDITDLDRLTVSGDVHFGKNVVLKGDVIIIAHKGDRVDIPSGSILENKIVSGNLLILEH